MPTLMHFHGKNLALFEKISNTSGPETTNNELNSQLELKTKHLRELTGGPTSPGWPGLPVGP